MTKSKSFPLEVVLSVTTGFVLTERPGTIHELMDVLYPGIMTLGMAAMADRAAQRVLEQHPDLRGLTVPVITAKPGPAWLEAVAPWLDEQRTRFGTHRTIVHDPRRAGPSDRWAAEA